MPNVNKTRITIFVDPPVGEEIEERAWKARLTVSAFLRDYLSNAFPPKRRRKAKTGETDNA